MINATNPFSFEAQPACASYGQQSQSNQGSKKTPFVFQLRRQTLEQNAVSSQSAAQVSCNPFF